ncbi:MAG: efflux RND transporter periplasmic adaptor subunit [Hyphomicrobiales bacterium]
MTRKLALFAILVPLVGLLAFVALRSGPLAPIQVTIVTASEQSISPALFGIGTVEARYVYRIGPTVAGRVATVDVTGGDRAAAGSLLGEMDPVDLDDRILAADAALRRAEAAVAAAEAQITDSTARAEYAEAQARRYDKLSKSGVVSDAGTEARRQDFEVAGASLAVARANLAGAGQELARATAERDALVRQRANLRLVAPVDGLVVARDADPGTTVVAGQSVLQLVDPASLWINVRFDQLRSAGLTPDLPATIGLRSRAGAALPGKVLRIEPLADEVTEEILAKVVFDTLPDPLPPIGEIAEITVALPALAPAPVLPEAAIRRIDGRLGVWIVDGDGIRFAPVRVGAIDLDGNAQVLSGLAAGDAVVLYSQRALSARSRVTVVDKLPGVPQ